jgi:hypothetical protein
MLDDAKIVAERSVEIYPNFSAARAERLVFQKVERLLLF